MESVLHLNDLSRVGNLASTYRSELVHGRRHHRDSAITFDLSLNAPRDQVSSYHQCSSSRSLSFERPRRLSRVRLFTC